MPKEDAISAWLCDPCANEKVLEASLVSSIFNLHPVRSSRFIAMSGYHLRPVPEATAKSSSAARHSTESTARFRFPASHQTYRRLQMGACTLLDIRPGSAVVGWEVSKVDGRHYVSAAPAHGAGKTSLIVSWKWGIRTDRVVSAVRNMSASARWHGHAVLRLRKDVPRLLRLVGWI